MNDEEIRSTLEQIKAQVKAKPENAEKSDDEIDEMILDSFYKAYTEGKMTKEDLGGLAEMMGYEFTEEFDQDPEAANELNPEQGAEGEPNPAPEQGEGEGQPGATQEDLEAVRTMEPGESAEEFKEKVDEVKEGGHVADDDDKGEGEGEPAPASEPESESEDDDDDDEDDEDEERKKASELWKMNLNK